MPLPGILAVSATSPFWETVTRIGPTLSQYGTFFLGIAALATAIGAIFGAQKLWPKAIIYFATRSKLEKDFETVRSNAQAAQSDYVHARSAMESQRNEIDSLRGTLAEIRAECAELRRELADLKNIKAKFEALVDWVQQALDQRARPVPPLPDILRDHFRIPDLPETEAIDAL